MAFSLIEHLQSQYAAQLNSLLPLPSHSSAPRPDQHTLPHHLIAVVIGQLWLIDRQPPAQTGSSNPHEQVYQAIVQQDQSWFSQQLDWHQLNQMATYYAQDPNQFKNALLEIFRLLSQEIRQLDEVASFGPDGVSELIHSQQEFLVGQVPDDIWGILGLTELQGQPAAVDQTADLAGTMASLSKMISEAQQAHPNSATPADSSERGFAPSSMPSGQPSGQATANQGLSRVALFMRIAAILIIVLLTVLMLKWF